MSVPIVTQLIATYVVEKVKTPEILCDFSDGKYDQAREVFNRRFTYYPLAIVLCETAKQVGVAVRFAKENSLELRVRSGGHDHEGDSSATGALVLDLSKMNQIDLDTPGTVRVGPGNIFLRLTAELARHDVMIPHGTATTVGVGGFVMGGGWGPWTRKHGMCCESVVGAEIVLGDGQIKKVDQSDPADLKNLLWAIKGGGGFSYGIVTEFEIRTFALPPILHKFSVDWNVFKEHTRHADPDVPTMHLLHAWETAIGTTGGEADRLIGTNLFFSARPPDDGQDNDVNKVRHQCTLRAFWEGDRRSLEDFIRTAFPRVKDWEKDVHIEEPTGNGHAEKGYCTEHLMNDWHRPSRNRRRQLAPGGGKPLQPEPMVPTPHKLTSRLASAEEGKPENGLGPTGRKDLIETLTSSLILPADKDLFLQPFVSLNAITGRYYQNDIKDAEKTASAFPYKDRLYVIQHQAWWQEGLTNKPIRMWVNRALDWIDTCRKTTIKNTSGAFISFKDVAVPTQEYFGKETYEELVKIKEKYSMDPDNIFRSRKTIT